MVKRESVNYRRIFLWLAFMVGEEGQNEPILFVNRIIFCRGGGEEGLCGMLFAIHCKEFY